MGSSRRRHSTGRKAGAFRARKGKVKTSQPPPASADDAVSDAMGQMDEAICVVRAAEVALQSQQTIGGRVDPTSNAGAEALRTLTVGSRLLRHAYDQLDTALLAVLP